jgi:hypothetical protein
VFPPCIKYLEYLKSYFLDSEDRINININYDQVKIKYETYYHENNGVVNVFARFLVEDIEFEYFRNKAKQSQFRRLFGRKQINEQRYLDCEAKMNAYMLLNRNKNLKEMREMVDMRNCLQVKLEGTY